MKKLFLVIGVIVFLVLAGQIFKAYQQAKNSEIEATKASVPTDTTKDVLLTNTSIQPAGSLAENAPTIATVNSDLQKKSTTKVIEPVVIKNETTQASSSNTGVGYNEVDIINSVNLIYKKERDYLTSYYAINKKFPSYQFNIKLGGKWGNVIPENSELDKIGVRDLLMEYSEKYPKSELVVRAVEPMGFSVVARLPSGQQYCIDANDFSGKGLFDNFDGWCQR